MPEASSRLSEQDGATLDAVAADFDRWNRRYLEMAALVATWSKDPGGKVGAVVVGQFGQILSTGYNGFPRSLHDLPTRLHDRPTKLKYTVHAEQNCIYNASLSGVSLLGSTIYVSGLPTCSECAKGIIQAGIQYVTIPEACINISKTWNDSWKDTQEMFREAGITVTIVKEPTKPENLNLCSEITIEDEIGESAYMRMDANRRWVPIKGQNG